jgi:hypothetical protein
MSLKTADTPGATGVTLDLAGRRPSFDERPLGLGVAGHALAAEVEHRLVQQAEPVSAQLEKLFVSANESVPEPPPGMNTYLERVSTRLDEEGNRRQTERVTLLATVVAIPLNEADQPCGEPFKAVARDASEGGMSLLHTRSVRSERLAVRWKPLATTGSFVTAVMRVDRCRPMGPFYEVAGEFLRHAPSEE